MDSAHGRRVWKKFLKTKKGTEDPLGLIASKVGLKNKSSYLDIGGGTGEKTLSIAKIFGINKVDFLEPSEKASVLFSKAAKKRGLDFRAVNTSFENFTPSEKYGLITSIHSWYYIDLQELDKLYNILEKGGVACIYLDRKDDVIKKIQDICEKWLGFESNNIEDIVGYLEKRKIKFRLFCEEKPLKSLIKDGRLTEKAKTIISLVSYTRWNKIPASVKEEIRKMLIESGKSKWMTKRCLILIRK